MILEINYLECETVYEVANYEIGSMINDKENVYLSVVDKYILSAENVGPIPKYVKGLPTNFSVYLDDGTLFKKFIWEIEDNAPTIV